MKAITEQQAVKKNAFKLAKHHIKHCEGAECDISLFLLLRLLEMAGIKLTNGERNEFNKFI
jgi:recombinational DNA repair protein (RecF pathway)